MGGIYCNPFFIVSIESSSMSVFFVMYLKNFVGQVDNRFMTYRKRKRKWFPEKLDMLIIQNILTIE